MDKNVNINKSGGMGFCSILTLIFVVLKAFKIINFTWFQCFLPIIIGYSIVILLIIVLLICSKGE